MKCAYCDFNAKSGDELGKHDAKEHSKKIDPGAEFSAPKSNKTIDLIAFIRRHPDCTLRGGEANLLVKEIDRLIEERSALRGKIEAMPRYAALGDYIKAPNPNGRLVERDAVLALLPTET